MNRHEVHLLQQVQTYPSVTILLPTHRFAPDNKQDPIRLKNLMTETTNRLQSELGKRNAEVIITRLEELVATVDFRYTLDGLALFVNRDFARASILPFPVKERVIIDETFATRDLVYGLNHRLRYWLLVLSEKPTRLYEGINQDLLEIRSDGFPIEHTGPGGAARLPGGVAVHKSAYRDEYHRKFFRQVDDLLKPLMADDPLPLIIAGVDRHLAFFKEVTSHGANIFGEITGSHDKTSGPELGKLVSPLVEQFREEKRQDALGQLGKAISDRKVASTIGEVWRIANEGRGALLLVEEDFHFSARLDDSKVHLIPVEDPSEPGVIEDAVDEVIESVLSKQGQVVFVRNGDLAAHQRIALILRF